MDRDRFRTRAQDLRKLSEQLVQLSTMPDRVTKKDLESSANLMLRGAEDLDALLTVQLPGCVCRRVVHDDYDYLDYSERCLHHRQLHLRCEQSKEHYAKLEKALKDDLRLRFVTAALTGTASCPSGDGFLDNDDLIRRAIAIADETIDRIAREVS